ncbi:unnamed protein product [Choristocarpus tenellus]
MRYEGINRTSNENRSTTDSELFGDPTPNEDRRQNTPNYDFNLRKENLGQGKREHAFAEVYTPAGEQWAWKADDSTLVGEQWGWKSGKGLVSDCTEVTGVTRPWSEPVKGLPSGRGEGRKAGRELRAASGSRAGKGIRAGPTLGGRDRARGEGRQRSASSGCEPADRQVEDLNRVDLILSKLGTSTRSFSRPLDNHRPKGDAAAMPKAGPHAPVSEREFSQVIEDIEGSGVLEITDKSQEITDKSQEITDYVAATTASKCVNNGVNGEEDVSKTSIESFAEKAMAMDLRDTTKNQINDGERFGSNGGEVVGSDVGSEGKVVSAGAEFGPAEERKGSSKGVCLLSQSKHSDLEHISSDEESEDEKYNSKVQVDHYGFFINSERCGPDIPKVAMKKRVLKETSRTEKWLLMLTHFEDWQLYHESKLIRRVRKGIPDSVRGEVWQLISGSKEMMDTQPDRYLELLANGVKVDGPIEEDVPRTMYDHEMFCKKTGVHGRNMLRRVLTAYGRYDREVCITKETEFVLFFSLLCG